MAALLTTVALISIFVWVFLDDFRQRSVHVSSFALIFALSIFSSIDEKNAIPDLFLNAIVNFLFVLLLTTVVLGYIFIRYKARPKDLQHYIGAGDLLFWIAIIPLFPTSGFIPHFVASLVSALVLHWIFLFFSFYRGTTVPLAGIQGLYFASVLGYQLSPGIYES